MAATNPQNVNINSISRVPFVEKDGILSRSAYYFLLALFVKSGGSNSNATITDVQVIEAIDSFTPASEAQLARQLAALSIDGAIPDNSSASIAVLSGILKDLSVLVATINDTPSKSVCAQVSSAVAGVNFPATGLYGDLTSIDLTPGEWDISALVDAKLNGAMMTAFSAGVSQTAGNSAVGLAVGDNQASQAPPTAAGDSSIAIPAWRQVVTAPTTYYLKYTATFSAGTPQAAGRISARFVCKGM